MIHPLASPDLRPPEPDDPVEHDPGGDGFWGIAWILFVLGVSVIITRCL